MFCDDRNVSEVDDERNLGISVFNEGRLSIFYELLDLVVVRSSSGKEITTWGRRRKMSHGSVWWQLLILALRPILPFVMLVKMFFFKLHGMKTLSRSY